MPQPLSEVSQNGKLTFGAGALRTSPFAGDVAYVIALWAHTDGDIASILSRMLKADIAVGTAMYLALISSNGQKAALRAAAKEALPAWQEILLRAIGSVVEPWRDQRNRFAHNVWGICPDVPNAILLTHPKTIVNHNVSHRQRVMELPDGRGVIRPRPIDDTQIMVYRKADFKQAIENAERARDLYRLFYATLSSGETSGPQQQLLTDDAVRARAHQMAGECDDEVKAFLGMS